MERMGSYWYIGKVFVFGYCLNYFFNRELFGVECIMYRYIKSMDRKFW